jgi:sulfur carrier protein
VIEVNGKPAQLGSGSSVTAVLEWMRLDINARGVAVAVDGEVVPRSDWDTFRLRDSARVEVLGAMQGG